MIYSRFIEGYLEIDNSRRFPNNDVRGFFGLESVEISEETPTYNENYFDKIPF